MGCIQNSFFKGNNIKSCLICMFGCPNINSRAAQNPNHIRGSNSPDYSAPKSILFLRVMKGGKKKPENLSQKWGILFWGFP